MGQWVSKKLKKREDSTREYQQSATLHQPSRGAAGESVYSEKFDLMWSYVEDSGNSTEDHSEDHIDLYRRFEAAVREWVASYPLRGTVEQKRKKDELIAASQSSRIRGSITHRLLSHPDDYTDVSLIGSITASALHWAAGLQSADLVNVLLSSGKWTDIESRTVTGSTPLMYACSRWDMTPTEKSLSDRQGTVESLLSCGADVHARNMKGQTALQIALESGYKECAEALFRAGSSVADLKDSERGAASGVIEGMINDQAPNASGNMDELERIRKTSTKSGSPSPLQVPINFLGDFKAGKSSLAASLENNRPFRVADKDRTVGAKVKLVRFKGMDFYIHDFGGHASYRFLHHLYLPPFAIHVLFIKVGLKFDPADCCHQLNQWMFFVSAKVPNAKVVVVLSKVDLLTEADLEEAVSSLNHQLRRKTNGERETVDTWSSNIKSALSSVLVNGKELPGYETIKKNMEDAEKFGKQHPEIMGDILCVSCEKGKERGLEQFLERCASVVKESEIEKIDGRPLFFRLSDFHKSWGIFLGALLNCRDKGRLALPMSEVRQKAAEAGIPKEDVPLCLFLFKTTGHILHYESSENDLDQYVFHDPELLAMAMGHLVHHDLTRQFENYLICLSNMPDEDVIRRNFENGWVPYDFIKLQLSQEFQSEGATFGDAVVLLSRYIGLCIVVDKQDSQGRQMVFVPCLVTRSRSEVDLSAKWGPAKKIGWEDFVMDLRLHKGLPIGFVERVLVEAAPFTRGNVNFKNGFFCISWNGCPMLLEEVSEPVNKFSRLRFKIRAESVNREVAAQDMTWLYFVFQKSLSYYPGVLAHIVAPFRCCSDHSYDVKGCLNQPYEVLESMECPQSSKMNPHSAADVFPVKKPDALGAVSIKNLHASATSGVAPVGELYRQGIDQTTVYISKGDPEDFGQFAIAFGDKVTTAEVSVIADYLFESSGLLFRRSVLSADERVEYEEGKKSARRLISKLKERAVITKLPGGTFDYNGLVRILYAVNLGRLCGQLLLKKPEETSAT